MAWSQNFDIYDPSNCPICLTAPDFLGINVEILRVFDILIYDGLVVIITDDMQQTTRIHEELRQFSPHPAIFFPDWETLPYDSFSPHQDIVSERLSCLYHLGHLTKGALILPINTLMQKVCPQSYLGGHVFIMKKGLQISRENLRLQLENAGDRKSVV